MGPYEEMELFKRYVDDIICTVRGDPHKLLKFEKSFHNNLQFTLEKADMEGDLAFLEFNVNVSRKSNIACHWYPKPTDTGIILNLRSFAPLQHKKNVVQGTVHRVFNATSNWLAFDQAVEQFTLEKAEMEGDLAFLEFNVNVSRKSNITCHSYPKSTDTGIILNLRSFAPLQHKKNVVHGTVHRVFNATSNWLAFDQAVEQFTLEKAEMEGDLAFLEFNVNVSRKSNITCHWYPKSTDTGLILNLRSFAPLQHKKNVVHGTVHRVFNATSNWLAFDQAVEKNNTCWTKKQYPEEWSSKIVNQTLENVISGGKDQLKTTAKLHKKVRIDLMINQPFFLQKKATLLKTLQAN